MKIPLVDLKAQYLAYKRELDDVIASTIEGTQFIGGKFHQEFAREFADYCGGGYVALCGNGTDALYLAIRAVLGQGDNTQEIITVSHTFIATAEAITMAGYRPVFVDIDPNTCLMDVSLIESKINQQTRGIVPVHIYGQMAPMDQVMAIAEKHDLKVIEDAAQAHGAFWGGKRPGQLSDAATFSFYPGKNLGAWGDGGAVFTRHSQLCEKITMLANHGRKTKYLHECEGVNSRLDGIQAGVLKVKLGHLDEWNEKRRQLASIYTQMLDQHKDIVLHKDLSNGGHVYHLFVIEVKKDRDRLVKELQDKNIGAGIHYPVPLHLQPAYAWLDVPEGALPVTEHKARQILSLPMFPEMTQNQVHTVADTLMACL